MRALQDKIQYKHQLETELQLEYLKALIQSHNATVLLTDEEINLIKTLVKNTQDIERATQDLLKFAFPELEDKIF